MNSNPKVSICVPNLNTRPYLEERFETIFKQTLQEWEMIVCDSYSDDGSWEYIQELAAHEPRMRIFQSPRNGIYAGFNDCIRKARGEYVYIATSDDTMMPECLERMVAELDATSDCNICQCELVVIDEKGVPRPAEDQWDKYTLGAYSRNLVQMRNKRYAPHDGVVHPALFTICTSITQLLIRRVVFDRVGLFDGTWGTIGDYEWEMRAGFTENCLYIPEKLATWRIHGAQATQNVESVENRLKMIDMSRQAYARAVNVAGANLSKIDIEDVVYCLKRDVVEMGYASGTSVIQRLRYLALQLRRYPCQVRDLVVDRFRRRHWSSWRCASRYDKLAQLLEKYNVPSPAFC